MFSYCVFLYRRDQPDFSRASSKHKYITILPRIYPTVTAAAQILLSSNCKPFSIIKTLSSSTNQLQRYHQRHNHNPPNITVQHKYRTSYSNANADGWQIDGKQLNTITHRRAQQVFKRRGVYSHTTSEAITRNQMVCAFQKRVD